MNQIVDKKIKPNWKDSIDNLKNRVADFDTLSGHPLDLCYFPTEIDDNYNRELGFPGEYP